MIAHELETPIASVRKLNEMLSAEGKDPGVRDYATTATERELDALTNLVRDVRAVAALEREGFEIEARRLPLEELLADAEVYASTLPGHHPIEVMVRGDPRAGFVCSPTPSVSVRFCATCSRTPPNTRQKIRLSSCG
jgi:signal transduction histidine kinase